MPRWTDALRLARRAAGLSAREVAARAGIAGSTVSEAERGRDPSHDTLERLARVLPALDVGVLLGRPVAPPSLARTWSFVARTLAFVARGVRLSASWTRDGLGPTRIEVVGLRSLLLPMRDVAVRRALALAACEGTGAAAHRLAETITEASSSWRVADSGVVHELVTTRAGLTYVRQEEAGAGRHAPPWGEPFAVGLSTWIRYPVLRLDIDVLRARGAPWLRLTPHAWPARLVIEPSEAHAAWDALHPRGPHGPHALRRATARLTVERPPLATCMGLECAPMEATDDALPDASAWRHAGPQTLRPDRRPIGERLAEARRREHVSQREVARRMGVSSSTLAEVETGIREPRGSTLRAIARALPGLSPHEVIAPFDEDRPCDGAFAWAWQRDLYGLASDEELTRIRIAADGTCRYECSILGLRFEEGRARVVRLRHGLTAARGGLAAPRLLALTSDVPEGALTVKVTRRETGALVHEVRLGPELAGRAVGYERTLVAGRPLPMSLDESPMFLTVAPIVPTRRLRLVLQFPRGSFPARHVAGCSPELMRVLDDGVPDLRERLHPAGWRVEASPSKGTLELEVRRPLLGVTYALGIWPLERKRGRVSFPCGAPPS